MATQNVPSEFGLDHLHLRRGHTGIFGVTAVELPPHSAHRGDDDFALVELPSWRFLDKADRLYAQDTR